MSTPPNLPTRWLAEVTTSVGVRLAADVATQGIEPIAVAYFTAAAETFNARLADLAVERLHKEPQGASENDALRASMRRAEREVFGAELPPSPSPSREGNAGGAGHEATPHGPQRDGHNPGTEGTGHGERTRGADTPRRQAVGGLMRDYGVSLMTQAIIESIPAIKEAKPVARTAVTVGLGVVEGTAKTAQQVTREHREHAERRLNDEALWRTIGPYYDATLRDIKAQAETRGRASAAGPLAGSRDTTRAAPTGTAPSTAPPIIAPLSAGRTGRPPASSSSAPTPSLGTEGRPMASTPSAVAPPVPVQRLHPRIRMRVMRRR